MTSRKTKSASKKLKLRALEQRIALDAAAVDTAMTEITLPPETDQAQVENAPSIAPEDLARDPVQQSDRKEIVFIDPSVDGIQDFFDNANPNIEVILLDADADGVEQIASILQGREDIDAIHIISHGDAGVLNLGNTQLTSDTINDEHADELAIIRAALSEDADFLIYGCNFGEDIMAVEALAEATGADVAASEDLTGAADLGGDWELEIAEGAIEAQALTAENWDGVLNTSSGASTDPADFDVVNTGGSANINLNAGESLLIQSGTFTGSINSFPADATIVVADGATFNPGNFNNWSGELIVIGEANFNNANVGGGAIIQNEGMLTFNNSPNFNGAVMVTNHTDGELFIQNNLQLNQAGLEFTNNGEVTIDGNLDGNSGSLTNNGTLNVDGNFTANNITLTNNGLLDAAQQFTANSNATIVNNSVIVAVNGLTNNSGSFDNAGHIVLTGASASFVNNGSGAITSGPDARVSGVNFTNDGAVTGGGEFVFSGLTINRSTFSGTGGETINFFDTSPTGQVFDNQNTNPTNTTSNNATAVQASDTPASSSTALDTDGDSIPDSIDIDDDNDGILDSVESPIVTENINIGNIQLSENGDGSGFFMIPILNDEGDDIGSLTLDYFGFNGVGGGAQGGDGTNSFTPSIEIGNIDGQLAFQLFYAVPDIDGFEFGYSITSNDLNFSNLEHQVQSEEFDSGADFNRTDSGEYTYVHTLVENPTVSANSSPTNHLINGTQIAVGQEIANGDTISRNSGRVLNRLFHLEFDLGDSQSFGINGAIDSSRNEGTETAAFVLGPVVQRVLELDTDQDGIADHLDLDSDNDGITDNVEAQATDAYRAPSGNDDDMDGLDDAYDTTPNGTADGAGSLGLTPEDTDFDLSADYIDTDSDNDGLTDAAERGDGEQTTVASGLSDATTDADGDGLFGVFENGTTTDGFDVNDSNVTTAANAVVSDKSEFNIADTPTLAADLSNVDGTRINLAYRDGDTDNDGVIDSIDVDDDNDGILDVVEGLASVSVAPPLSVFSTETSTVPPTANITTPSTGFVVTDTSAGSNLSFTAVAPGEAGVNAPGRGTISEITFDVDLAPNEFLSNPTFTASTAGGFDDGLIIQINNVTIVEFDFSDIIGNGPLTAEFDLNNSNAWTPWTNEGFPEVEVDLLNGTVAVTALANDGTRKNVLDFMPAAVQPNPFPVVDLEAGVTFGIGLNNLSGGANIGDITVNFDSGALGVVTHRDTDGDGVFDHLDIDSDNDGITDNVEAQTTAGYIAPSGIEDGITDADGDGLDDNYDAAQAAGGAGSLGLTPVDTDIDGDADFIDTDSDNDLLSDAAERGDGQQATIATGLSATAGNDTDGDGLFDVFEDGTVSDGFDVNDSNVTTADNATVAANSEYDLSDTPALAADLSNVDGTRINLAYRDNDTDNDGVADVDDIDDDNDGILDTVENLQVVNLVPNAAPVRITGTGTQTDVQNGDIWEFQNSGVINGEAFHLRLERVASRGTVANEDVTISNSSTVSVSNFDARPGDYVIFEYSLINAATNQVVPIESLEFTLSDIDGFRSANSNIRHTEIVGFEDGFDSLNFNSGRLTQGGFLNRSTPGGFTTVRQSFNQINAVDNDSSLNNVTVSYSGVDSFQILYGVTAPTGQTASNVDNLGRFFPFESFNAIVQADTDGDGILNIHDIDSDNDGITDNVEAQATDTYRAPSGNDADGDGLDDAYDTTPNGTADGAGSLGLTPENTDGDTLADYIDVDSDNDRLTDAAERGDGQQATISTGLSDNTTDADGDGLFDVFEGGTTEDGFDVNDGNVTTAADAVVMDSSEFNLTDIPTLADDLSNVDGTRINLAYRDGDTDNDGVVDSIDVDDDNDGILDENELDGFGGNTQLTYVRTNAVITDGRTAFNNPANTADGNAGPSTGLVFNMAASGEPNTEFVYALSVTGDTIVDTFELRASVGNTLGDFDVRAFDLEIYDASGRLVFSGSAPDMGFVPVAQVTGFNLGSGLYSVVVKPLTSGGSGTNAELAEVSFVGVSNIVDTINIDADADLVLSHRDIDADNDGITDNIEAQRTIGYVAPSGIENGITDINNDGLDDTYDTRTGLTAASTAATTGDGDGLTPVNTDGGDTADYIDTDSDNEGGSDAAESGTGATAVQTGLSITIGNDSDGDGLFDVFENGTATDGFIVNDGITNPSATFMDTDVDVTLNDPLTHDVDYRDAVLGVDTDGDGVFDIVDIDDDNDGILDTVEMDFFETGDADYQKD